MSYKAQVLHFDGQPIIIWTMGDIPYLETQHLARVLGYVQPGSIRKQIGSDWGDVFSYDEDMRMAGEDELRAYETFERLHVGQCKPANPDRGRLFLNPSGIRKVLKRSTKTTQELETFFELKVLIDKDDLIELTPDPNTHTIGDVLGTMPLFQQFEEADSSSTSQQPSSSEEGTDSKFQYEAIQQLLHNLKEHDEPSLRELAIEAAEMALGRRLNDIRKKVLDQDEPAPPPRETEGPLFEEEGWYSFKQMGALAGGYSSNLAGKAANVVAERWDFSPTDIRKKTLHFNTFVSNEVNGRVRTWAKFNRAFSNEVICELRGNELFTPKKTPSAEAELGARRSYVDLSKGPFDEEGDETSDNMESFIETLEGEQPTH